MFLYIILVTDRHNFFTRWWRRGSYFLLIQGLLNLFLDIHVEYQRVSRLEAFFLIFRSKESFFFLCCKILISNARLRDFFLNISIEKSFFFFVVKYWMRVNFFLNILVEGIFFFLCRKMYCSVQGSEIFFLIFRRNISFSLLQVAPSNEFLFIYRELYKGRLKWQLV